MEVTLEQALQQAVASHKAGKLQNAERLYRAILQSRPLHPDANHNLGVLAMRSNRIEVALSLFKTALEANPKIEQFWLSYIEALIKLGQLDNARLIMRQANKQGLNGDKLNSLKVRIDAVPQTKKLSDPNPPREQLSLLIKYYQNKQFNESEQLALSITQNFPDNPL